jgi:hypothetical protein
MNHRTRSSLSASTDPARAKEPIKARDHTPHPSQVRFLKIVQGFSY